MKSNTLSSSVVLAFIAMFSITGLSLSSETRGPTGHGGVKFESLAIEGKIKITEPSDPLGESLLLSADILLGQGTNGIEPAEEEISLYFMIPEIPSGYIVIPAGVLKGGSDRFEFNDSSSPGKLGIRVLRRDDFERIVADLSESINFFNVTLTCSDERGLRWHLKIEASATSDIINPTFLPLGATYITKVTIGDDTGSSAIKKSK